VTGSSHARGLPLPFIKAKTRWRDRRVRSPAVSDRKLGLNLAARCVVLMLALVLGVTVRSARDLAQERRKPGQRHSRPCGQYAPPQRNGRLIHGAQLHRPTLTRPSPRRSPP
jgi:hypothetical protein